MKPADRFMPKGAGALFLACVVLWTAESTASGLSVSNPPEGTRIGVAALADTEPIDRSRWYGAREDVVVLTVTNDVYAQGLKVIGSGSDVTVPLNGESGQPVTVEVVSRNGVPIKIYGRFQHEEVAGRLPVPAQGFRVDRTPGSLIPYRRGTVSVPKGMKAVFVTAEFPVPPHRLETFDWIIRYWTPATPPSPVSLAEIRYHALAFGGILDSMDGFPHSTLDTPRDEEESKSQPAELRQLMADWWGIHSRAELIDMLVKLQNSEHGHRSLFWEIRRKLLEGKMENYLEVIKEDGPGTPIQRFIVATHLGRMKGKALPLTAWDFGRYIFLCRQGYNVGWLTEKEAWSRIIPAARLLQASYSSWDEYAADYLLGRYFWAPDETTEMEHIRYIIGLLESPTGLWSAIPWNGSLGEGLVMRDVYASRVLRRYNDPDGNRASDSYVPKENPMVMRLLTDSD